MGKHITAVIPDDWERELSKKGNRSHEIREAIRQYLQKNRKNSDTGGRREKTGKQVINTLNDMGLKQECVRKQLEHAIMKTQRVKDPRTINQHIEYLQAHDFIEPAAPGVFRLK